MENYFNSRTLHYHIRLTLDIELKNVTELCDMYSGYYLISNELTHFHIYLRTTNTKEEITKGIKEKFNVSGNKYFSVQLAKDKEQLKKYVLKDGNYHYKGIEQSEVEALFKASFKKGKDKFMVELENLELQLMKNEITLRQFSKQYVQLKVNYNQNIMGNQIKAYVTKMAIKSKKLDPDDYITELFKNENHFVYF